MADFMAFEGAPSEEAVPCDAHRRRRVELEKCHRLGRAPLATRANVSNRDVLHRAGGPLGPAPEKPSECSILSPPMRIQACDLPDVHLVQTEPAFDERGFFARTFDRRAFTELGLRWQVEQTSLSFSRTLGTLRGLHWQAAPSRESKLVRVVRGTIYDVVVDVREDSPTFGQWRGFELSAANGMGLYVPEGCAHGFLTLENEVELIYQMSESYRPELSRTLRWDDPDLDIEWPIAPRVISPADAECRLRFADLHPSRRVA